MSKTKFVEVSTDRQALLWENLNWPLIEAKTRRLQNRIYYASLTNKHDLMHRLQKVLCRSLYTKTLAVRRVTTLNKGKNTPGSDRITVTSNKQKMELALSLNLDGKAGLIRRVYKPGRSEKRPLGIPIIFDRAKQALALMALEPQWEAKFEPNSYGFRPGRCCQDAVEAIFLSLRHGPRFVLDADIAQCFDKINHEALIAKLETYPQMSIQISSWLKADIMTKKWDGSDLDEPTISGTPQGISPLLSNIALHGIETAIHNQFSKPRSKASLIRYADDFVIIHNSKEVIEQAQIFLNSWLANIGLELKPEKTSLVSSKTGFDFLGFNFIHVGKNSGLKTKITPSYQSRKNFLITIREVIQSSKSIDTRILIKRLAPKIVGWGNYFSVSEIQEVYSSLDNQIHQKLRAWALRRHPTWAKERTLRKYFLSGIWPYQGKKYNDKWVLAAENPDNPTLPNFLIRLAWIPSKKHVKVKGSKSPYDGDSFYWSQRLSNHSFLGREVSFLLKRQTRFCARCRAAFITGDVMEVDHIIPRGIYANKQLLHKQCHILKTSEDVKNTRGAV
jgi:RNA-directed DNA polymerase